MEIEFGCCYCGNAIDRDNMLAVIASWGEGESDFQQWWAHPRCFVNKLQGAAGEDLAPALEERLDT